ncbi:phosphoadenylyl-sulfate reductase [Sanguibacter sp. HDW7]|uniref:phosphoadenylyl-sulfate reductase n=1 Tax=Sanguibacter sp. HDW7 TaxID=2714931 RepID=UPI00140BA80C|nr:phosphoadenylyl-sulfate reductase [Sanguibacter sp. HDW7]QIK84029.1 phosphoadenylyl-sulfate reductase [Sanguibacter sp. HDW7]
MSAVDLPGPFGLALPGLAGAGTGQGVVGQGRAGDLAAFGAAGRARAAEHERARVAHAAARAARDARRRSDDELKRLAAEGAALLSPADGPEASADEISAWAAETFGDLLTVACSMADLVLPHVVAQRAPWVDVLFLETGYHFPETIGTRDAAAATMPITVVDVAARQSVAEQDAQYGPRLHERDPGLCCALRKVAPLQASLGGYEAWVTGVRRDEAPTRTGTPLVSWDEKNRLVKINPLAAWSFDDLLGYATQHKVLLNPLLDDGYPSIGCAPCTRRVAPGEDPRSGRWAGLDKTECGLHA